MAGSDCVVIHQVYLCVRWLWRAVYKRLLLCRDRQVASIGLSVCDCGSQHGSLCLRMGLMLCLPVCFYLPLSFSGSLAFCHDVMSGIQDLEIYSYADFFDSLCLAHLQFMRGLGFRV